MGILSDALTSGGKSLKPENIGDTVGATITSVELAAYTDFITGEVETWDDGKPKQQMNILVTDDATGEPRGIYVKLWGAAKRALVEAIEATGLEADLALAPGNHITMTLEREEPNKNPRLNATKIYRFKITPRTTLNGALDTTPATPAAPAPATPAAPAPATPAAKPAVDVAALIKAGLNDAQIATATGLDVTAIAAIRDIA